MKLSEIPSTPPKILLYGPLGSGKTGLALSGGKKVQLIDLDMGVKTGLTLKDDWAKARMEADVIPCYEDNPSRAYAYLKFKGYLEAIAQECTKGTYPFKVLAIDSLTNWHEFCMRSILANSGQLGKPPQLQHWGLRDVEFLNTLILLKSLPICVIVTAHQAYTEVDSETVINPDLPGKRLPNNMWSKFDEVLYMKPRLMPQGKILFAVRNTSTSGITVRTRSNFPDNFNASSGLAALLKLIGYEI